MSYEEEPVSVTAQDLIHKHAVRLVLEEVTYSPTRITFVKGDDGWTKDECHEYEESHRITVKEERLCEADSEEAEMRFEQAIFRLKSNTLRQKELKELTVAITFGLQQVVESIPLDGTMVNTILRNTLSEIAHSMNRKGLDSNDDVGTFLADLYTEMKV